MNARAKIITLFVALGFLVGWTATPTTCAAQCYGYQLPPVLVYNYPNYYGYSQPAPVPNGYYVASPAPGPCHYKHRHKHKHKHKYRYEGY